VHKGVAGIGAICCGASQNTANGNRRARSPIALRNYKSRIRSYQETAIRGVAVRAATVKDHLPEHPEPQVEQGVQGALAAGADERLRPNPKRRPAPGDAEKKAWTWQERSSSLLKKSLTCMVSWGRSQQFPE